MMASLWDAVVGGLCLLDSIPRVGVDHPPIIMKPEVTFAVHVGFNRHWT